MSIYGGNWTTCAVGSTSTAGGITIETLVEALKKLPPPLPPPDPTKCINCREDMSDPAMPIYSAFPYGPPDAYLCGRCAVMVKREYFYKPRQRKLDSAASAKTAGGRG